MLYVFVLGQSFAALGTLALSPSRQRGGVRQVGGIRKYEDEFEKRELVRQLSGPEIVSGSGLN